DTQTDHDLRRARGLTAHLDQDSAELALLPHQVVRPFQPDTVDAEAPQGAHRRHADRETESRERRRRLAELPAQRHADGAAERRDPAAAAPAASRTLDFGDA